MSNLTSKVAGSSEKLYEVGMYGGKFMPFHKGHLHCLKIASLECKRVYLLLFINGLQEKQIRKINKDDYLSVGRRIDQIIHAALKFPNVSPRIIDVDKCVLPDGSEDWDAETPLVLAKCGKINAIYGSEPSYAKYFSRAYPEAVYRVIDNERKTVPISATEIRSMNEEERGKWIV